MLRLRSEVVADERGRGIAVFVQLMSALLTNCVPAFHVVLGRFASFGSGQDVMADWSSVLFAFKQDWESADKANVLLSFPGG